MHIAIVGPANLDTLAAHLHPEQQDAALSAPTSNTTAPGRIAKILLERGHDVTIVTHRRGNPGLELAGPRLRIIRVPSRSNRLTQTLSRWKTEITSMRDAIAASGADVVHSNWAYEGALATLGCGLPHVATIRDAPFTVLRYYPKPARVVRLTMALEFALRGRLSHITAVSPYLADQWQRQTFHRQDVTVIPNPSPPFAAPPTNSSQREKIVLEVADSSNRKNVWTLVEAFNTVHSCDPDVQLRLIGDGLGGDGPIAARARAAGLDAGVDFLGKVSSSEVARHMSLATIHAHMALEETFGNTLVEAMLAGTPVLGGESSAAVPWVLGHGDAGALVDVTDCKAVASALQALLTSTSERERLAKGGTLRINTVFSPDAVGKAYEQAYLKAMDSTT